MGFFGGRICRCCWSRLVNLLLSFPIMQNNFCIANIFLIGRLYRV